MEKVFILTIDGWRYCAKKYKRYIFGVLGFFLLLSIIVSFKSETTQNDGNFDFIDAAFQRYEDSTGNKLYPKGRQCLRDKAILDGLTTEDAVIKLIRENEKFM